MSRGAVLILLAACANTPPPPEDIAAQAAGQLAAYTFSSALRDPGMGNWLLHRLENKDYCFAQADPWGTPYRIETRERQFLQVRSCGSDRLPNTADDIVHRIDYP